MRHLKLTSFPVTVTEVEPGTKQVLIVEDWAEIRRLRRSEGVSISEIARLIGCSTALGDASPYLLELVVAGSSLAAPIGQPGQIHWSLGVHWSLGARSWCSSTLRESVSSPKPKSRQVQSTFFGQPLNLAQPHITGALEILGR